MRFIAAALLPLAVPAIITMAIWVLPGDPAEIICPPELCTGTQALAERWNLDQGPWHFYSTWLLSALSGDFGASWTVIQGYPVLTILLESLPATAKLVAMAMLPLLLGSVLAALGWIPKRLDALWQAMGLVPAVILALVFAAVVQINYGALSHDGWPGTLRLLCAALVLGVADGALAGAVVGTRSVFEEEVKQRYVQIAVLRGEDVLSNALPNVLPALVGQLRARTLHVLSGSVIVEVVLGVQGLGDMLWNGTLQQDFGLVLAAAWAFSLLSGGLLFVQGMVEVMVALYVRRSPAGVASVEAS